MSRDLSSGSPHATVVALCTPEGESGLAVVRMSGAQAVPLTRAVFRCAEFRDHLQSHHAYHGLLVWPEAAAEARTPGQRSARGAVIEGGQAVDEVIALPMLAPRSYTGEDTVEFFCHGGLWPARLVVAACLAAGARAAPPGEFTRRAFLNGKLSLDQAEAVADLIHAEDQLAASAALVQLQGGLDRQLASVEMPLRSLLADLEGSLEFGEEEDIAVQREEVLTTLRAVTDHLDELISLIPAGRRLREGVQIVLAGPPNVGKSSLLNAMLGEDRVLVDHEAGTTRDIVSARICRDGTLFVLHDTAGLRRAGGRVEAMGMERTLQALLSADIVLVLREAGSGSGSAGPSQFLRQLTLGAPLSEEAQLIGVGTKADLLPGQDPEAVQGLDPFWPTSAKSGLGIAELWRHIEGLDQLRRVRRAAALGVVLNARHQQKLMDCRHELALLLEDLAAGPLADEVLASILARILADLGEISGRVFTESLLDQVFSRFCVGK